MALAVFPKAVPALVDTEGSVLPGRRADSQPLPSLTCPLPFLSSSSSIHSERAREWLCDYYLMTSHCRWRLPGDRTLWWDPCWEVIALWLPMSLFPLSWMTAACTAGCVFEVHLADACTIISAFHIVFVYNVYSIIY